MLICEDYCYWMTNVVVLFHIDVFGSTISSIRLDGVQLVARQTTRSEVFYEKRTSYQYQYQYQYSTNLASNSFLKITHLHFLKSKTILIGFQ